MAMTFHAKGTRLKVFWGHAPQGFQETWTILLLSCLISGTLLWKMTLHAISYSLSQI